MIRWWFLRASLLGLATASACGGSDSPPDPVDSTQPSTEGTNPAGQSEGSGAAGNTGGASEGTTGGTPADGTPSGGTPAGGTPAGGTPAGGTPSGGTPAGGTPTDPGMGEPGMGEPGMGEPGMSEPGMGEPGMDEPADGMDQDPGVATGFQFKKSCSAPEPNESPGNPCPGSAPPSITLTKIAEARGPVYLDQAPGDPTRLYVVEQNGKIRVIKDGEMQAAPLLDMANASPPVRTGFEAGLLGMAFHPDFENNQKFYVNYMSGDTIIMEYVMTDPDSVDPASGMQILTLDQLADNHNGGMLAFGADGCLYIGLGDGGGEGDRPGHGQNKSTSHSSMLRIDVDNYPMAAPGNISDGYMGHTWSWGFRNPWRYSFDRANGDLYIGDVGQGIGARTGPAIEEVDVEPRGVAGFNYGWKSQEGDDCRVSDCSSFRLPAAMYEWPNLMFAPSVIGGYVYRGSAIPDMVGRYIYADWSDAELLTFVYKGEEGGQPAICDEHSTGVTVGENVRGFGEDNAGEIYVLGGNGYGGNSTGGVYRIDP
ncbi:MAG: PQQ-dependent sugar dehydrogenase [Myxococcales bacterium]|nr:PQQ-dependent sugar dehydrogenase [Myxococcales bacterium]MDD9968777.1 PQQ-dependent sugar dehydrogenase [Myxococcales bacterium]